MEREEDIISSKLPESLISQILSLIPLKDAVRTSVLSKIWIHRWMSITSFYLYEDKFYCDEYEAYRKSGRLLFINFVNKVLALTNGLTLETFSLVTTRGYEESLLNTWISDILMIRRVKHLGISIDDELSSSPFASHSFFSSHNYLEELLLDLGDCSIKVPPCGLVCFSSLKILKLYAITFTFDSSLDLNLPNLKKFKIEYCFWVSACAGSVTVDAPLLETISVKYDYANERGHPSSCAINFTASQVKKITYYGDGASQPIILLSPSSACNASANIYLFSSQFSQIKQFSQVKSLRLQVLPEPDVLPVFPMLCHLELDYVSCEVLLDFLQMSPFLNTLILDEVIISEYDQDFLNSSVVPECLTSTLRIVKFRNLTV